MNTAVTYQNIYNISVAFPVEYTILLTLASLALLIYGLILILEDRELRFSKK
jgi:hypothetical protein